MHKNGFPVAFDDWVVCFRYLIDRDSGERTVMSWIYDLIDGLIDVFKDISIGEISLWAVIVTCFGYRLIVKIFFPGGAQIGN